MKKNFSGKILLVFAILFVTFIACTENPNNYNDEFDPDGRLKEKYARQDRNIKICQAAVIILALEEQKQKCKDPSSNDCKFYTMSNWLVPVGNCYGVR